VVAEGVAFCPVVHVIPDPALEYLEVCGLVCLSQGVGPLKGDGCLLAIVRLQELFA